MEIMRKPNITITYTTMIELVENSFDSQRWNKCVSHPLQSWEWGQARHALNTSVVRFLDTSSQTGYQMTLHKIPMIGGHIGYIPRSAAPTKALIDYLSEYIKKHAIAYVKFEPDAIEYKPDARLVASIAPLFPQWTQVIDLRSSEDELMGALKSKTRYNIRLATRHGVIVKEETNTKGFEIFCKLYFDTCKRQKYHGHTPHYHKTVFETLRASKMAHILVAYYQDEPLAAYELFVFKNKLYYPYGGSSINHKHVMAPNVLMWETMRAGKSWGAASFDLWGSLPPDYDNKNPWSGFTRFKQGYGAEFVKMAGSYDLPANQLQYQVIINLQHLRTKLLEFV